MIISGNRLMKNNAFPTVMILIVVVLSALLSTDILTAHKTLFRSAKLVLALVCFTLIALRLIARFRPLTAEAAFFAVFILSVITACLTGSKLSDYVMTVDGPAMFFICLSGIISLYTVGTDTRTPEKIFLTGIFSFSVFMMLTSFAGFLLIVSNSSLENTAAVFIRSDNWNGILSNPNAMATHMLAGVVSGVLCLEYYNGTKYAKGFRIAVYTTLFMFLLDTLFLQCRGALVSSLVFIAGWGIIRMRRSRVVSAVRLIRIACVSLIVIVVCAYIEYRFEVLSRVIEKTRQQKSTHRIDFWITFLKNQMDVFPLRKVFFGFGIQDPSQHWYNTAATWYGMHNFIFELWGRYGVISALTVCAAVSASLMKYIRRFSADLFVMGLAVILMDNLFEDYLFIHIQLTTSMLGVFLLARIISAPVVNSTRDGITKAG